MCKLNGSFSVPLKMIKGLKNNIMRYLKYTSVFPGLKLFDLQHLGSPQCAFIMVDHLKGSGRTCKKVIWVIIPALGLTYTKETEINNKHFLSKNVRHQEKETKPIIWLLILFAILLHLLLIDFVKIFI